MLDWSNIDTVLLDMDGTLLDLRYDNHFWNESLHIHYAQLHEVPEQEAQEHLRNEFLRVAGTLDWYCLDYWQKRLKMPIRELKRRTVNLIQMRPDAANFLQQLRATDKQVALITNAHPDALALKNEFTQLKSLCPVQFSTHTLGYCKEFQELWVALQNTHPFDPNRTLFIDDGEHILDSAKKFGIRYTVGVRNPDSGLPHKTFERHPAIASFVELGLHRHGKA